MDIKVRDSNGAALAEGDSVTLIKDLKLKGSSTVLKRGTVIRNIHLTDNEDEIEGRTDKVKGLVLRTEFLKKAEIVPHYSGRHQFLESRNFASMVEKCFGN